MIVRQDQFSPNRAVCALALGWARFARGVAGLVCFLEFAFAGAGFPYKQINTPAGPITQVIVGQDGSLQIEHQDFPAIGQFYPKTVWPADCGFFLRHNGAVVGIDYARHDGTAAAITHSAAFQPISQTQSTDGRLVRTIMDNRTDGTGVPFKVSQYVSHLPGDPWISVSVVVQNESASAQTVDLFAAADAYVGDDDAGYPCVNTNCPLVVIGGTNSTRNFNLFIQAAPGSPQPTAYQEDFYATIWSIIGNSQHFADTICSDYRDNGAGLEWQDVTIPSGGSFGIAYYWAFGTATCLDPTERAQPIHILWSGGTNLVLHWDHAGWVLEASSNCLHAWQPLPISITDTEARVPLDLHQKMFYRLFRP